MAGTNNIGKVLKQQRVMKPMTLRELSAVSGISSSHLGRVERGERFPSAAMLRKVAQPLGFGESELFYLAGYLSSAGEEKEEPASGRLEPYVTRLLSQEPVEMQRTVIGILSILKTIARLPRGG
jgi:transcriptional regulator with XRE-family HTH domain